MKGRVVRVSGLQYLVEISGESWQCKLRGRLKEGVRRTTSPVIVGDWVEVSPLGTRTGVIESIQPRYSQFSRAASGSRPYEQIVAVNLDQLIVVVAVHQPKLRLGFIDRVVVMGLKGGMQPVVCINKVDLDTEGKGQEIGQVYRDLGYTVLFTSACTGEGVTAFQKVLKDRVSGMIGQSGVGKSSLLNHLDPGLSIKTQQLMKQHDRGKHTTAAVQLYKLAEGGYVADTPGIKELNLWEVDREELVHYFVEMSPLVPFCQFRDCIHLHEPGCAIREGVKAGRIAPTRYAGYQHIMESL